MANTPNMNLPIDSPGITPGPQWATDLESVKTLLDTHTHISGQGIQVPSAGLNINATLPFGGNAASGLSYLGLASQSSTSSGTLFAALQQSGGNLYWNNNSGVPVQLTSGGSVNVAPTLGSITNLGGTTAALTYSAALSTFIATANTGISAGWDGAAVTIRPAGVANAQGITLAAPTGLTAYTATLPSALPAASGLLLLGPTGTVEALTTFIPPAALSASGIALVSKTGQVTVASGILSAALPPANQLSVYRAAAFNCGPGAYSGFIADSVQRDAAGGYSTTNGVYTIPAAGDWLFTWNLGLTSVNAAKEVFSALVINSGINNGSVLWTQGSAQITTSVGSYLYCNALVNDKVMLRVWNGDAVTCAMVVGSGSNWLQGYQVR